MTKGSLPAHPRLARALLIDPVATLGEGYLDPYATSACTRADRELQESRPK